MPTNSKADVCPKGYVATGTFYTAMIIALAVGFVTGVVFSAFKNTSGTASIATSMPGATSIPGATSMPGMTDASPENRLKKMAEALEAELAKNPDNADLWVQLGHTRFDAGEPEAAIRAYETGLQKQPDEWEILPDVLTDLGVMYRKTEDYAKAIACFDKAIAARPSHETARYNKGIVLRYDMDDIQGAVAVWNDLLEINPVFAAPDGTPLTEMVRQQTPPQGG